MMREISYTEAVKEFGQELAAALCEEEYNQFIRGFEQAPATDYIPFDDNAYIDFLETIGSRKVKSINEKLYRMEKGF